ncbi:MAG: CoA transferase [Proteobacteria bacterium]|nr:CoA transferase [Pseudomonadota bacterium]
MTSILEGILVLDFSEYIAGPYCGTLLADLGAEVVKIEPPDGGEERRFGGQARYRGNTRMSLSLNRGKRGLCLDLKTEEGRRVVYRLVEKADVVVQNFVPGAAEKLGIDYETLAKINKRLVFISSTAFGDVGPYRKRKGFDIIAHAASGIMSRYADEEGRPRGPGGMAYMDVGTAMLNALAAVSALFSRTRTGEGQKIETSLFSTGMAMQSSVMTLIEELDRERHEKELDMLKTAHQQGMTHTQIIDAFAELRIRTDQPDTTRPVEVPDCNHRPGDRQVYPYYRVYETGDGYIGLAALNAKQRNTVCEVLGIPDRGANIQIGDIPDDIYFHQKEVMKRIEERLKTDTNDHWMEVLEGAGVPCGPVNYSADLWTDPQAEAVDMVWDLENSEIGPYKMPGHPIRFLKTPVTPGRGAPTLGEHSEEILKQFGYSEKEIDELKERKVVK